MRPEHCITLYAAGSNGGTFFAMIRLREMRLDLLVCLVLRLKSLIVTDEFSIIAANADDCETQAIEYSNEDLIFALLKTVVELS